MNTTTNNLDHPLVFRVITTRKVTVAECPWLGAEIAPNTVLWKEADLYRVCTPEGILVAHPSNSTRHVEVPRSAVQAIVEEGYEAEFGF